MCIRDRTCTYLIDSPNCGACDVTCVGSNTCINSRCATQRCFDPYYRCDPNSPTCHDLDNDRFNCGACGVECRYGCSRGSCNLFP